MKKNYTMVSFVLGGYSMARTVGIGYQDYGKLIEDNAFYIDKTLFIKEWWENLDRVILITCPRRFGKTLNMNMLEKFFSLDYVGRSDLFEDKDIWKEEKYQKMQGKYPVISLSFANVKEDTFEKAKIWICQILSDLYDKKEFLKNSGLLTEKEINYFNRVSENMVETDVDGYL